MNFNPFSCEVLHITQKRNPHHSAGIIHDHTLAVAEHHTFTRPVLEPHAAAAEAATKKASNSLPSTSTAALHRPQR